MTVLSFSILALILFNCSTCSCISAMASWCFFLSPTMVASCWILASSRSLLSLVTSASLFLFNSIWALVAPEASLRRSPRFSSSRARSDLWRSALALPCLSASSSSSISSILGAGGSTGLIETLTKVLQLTGEVRSLALSLSSALSLSLKFLLHLLNSGLNLLDGLLDLGNQGLFVLKLAHQARGILLLASNGILKFLPGSLQFRNSFLHNLQFSLNLPSFLLNVGSATLLLLIRALQLIKS